MDTTKDEVEVTTEEELDYEADGVEEEETEEEYTEEETEEEETEETEAEDDFDYDEDGNIILPEDEETEEADDVDDSEGEEEAEPSEVDEEPTAEPTAPDAPTDDKPTAPDERDAEIAELRRQLAELNSVGKDMLERLGVDEKDDVLMGLAELAADAEGISKEEYLAKKKKKDDEDLQRRAAQTAAFEQMAKADLAALQAEFPETQAYKTIRDMPADILAKFGRFRDMGLSPKEAYSAANPDGIRTTVATASRQKASRESKSHLTSAVPKGSRDTSSVRMTKSELAEWRSYFPGKSDKEIVALYRKTSKN